MNTQDKNLKSLSFSGKPSFVTDFLPLVATLVYHDFPIVSIHKDNPRHAYFEFSETYQLKDTADKFWAGMLRIEPKRYFSTLKEIKSRLYEQIDEPNRHSNI